MREFTCVVCGKLAIDTSRRGDQKYCSKDCRKVAEMMKKGGGGRSDITCQYNEGVACGIQTCESCGWNPVVEKRRKEALYERQTADT